MKNTSDSTVLFWHRRDIRLTDNKGLSEALASARKNGCRFLPVFIFDPHILQHLRPDDARVHFISEQLQLLKQDYQKHGVNMAVYFGMPSDVFAQLIQELHVTSIFTNHDYEPYAIERDERIARMAENKNVVFKTFKDQVIFEKNEVVTDTKKPYTVYTPYKKKWLQRFAQEYQPENQPEKLQIFECDFTEIKSPASTRLQNVKSIEHLSDLNFQPSKIVFPERKVKLDTIRDYATSRDFPARANGTTHLGVHLRFGTVSPRTLIRMVLKDLEKTGGQWQENVWISELIWREFFMQILFHFPHSVDASFKPQYDQIQWRRSDEDFARWCAGQTGYPIVDAGMRELVSTGYMHNRVRMITASFLCKHLLHYWKQGERFFADHLLDYDLSANVGNWQWAAGTGCDAAPYFRIFNPYTQTEKFDPKLEYVKKWVPEFQSPSYKPMVDHAQARVRCLDVYKKGLA